MIGGARCRRRFRPCWPRAGQAQCDEITQAVGREKLLSISANPALRDSFRQLAGI